MRSHVTATNIEVTIDEGRVERIVYLGPLTYELLRFKLGLKLPHDVFDARLLDAQLKELSVRFGTPAAQWQLVHHPPTVHEGPQLTRLPRDGEAPYRPYEVLITVPPAPGESVGIEVRAYYVDGLEVGIHHVASGLAVPGDALTSAVSAGVGLREHILTPTLYPYFSRAALSGSYSAPPFLRWLTPTVWAEASIVSRQRSDLLLEDYWAFTTDAAVQLELAPSRGLRLVAGGGFEYRMIFGLEAPPGFEAPIDLQSIEHARPFVRATHASVFNPDVVRWDRRHALESELRWYFPLRHDLGMGWFDLRYQYVHELGWHDFWVKGRAHAAWGDVTFHDEISVGEFARGIALDQWVRSGASLLLEFRYSLVRDIVKIGVFHDLAVFAVPASDGSGALTAELAEGLGPTLNLLLFDMFQLDLYLGFGFRPQTQPHVSVSMVLNKAF